MSKLTFRADDELVERVESLDASKSEIMREALRSYLDELDDPRRGRADRSPPTLDSLIEDRIDALIDERLRERAPRRDVNVNVNLSREAGDVDRQATTPQGVSHEDDLSDREPADQCAQCGETLGGDHVYCPNCGEKRSRRVFCECGDELRTDWSFCPGCGRRTPAADVLDQA